MPYSAAHRQKVRQRIIDSARRLFNRHGFDNVSIDDIMGGVQLTHGSFYSYFRSKGELYSEVLACFFTDPQWKNTWEGVHIDMTAAVMGPQIVRAYLSRQHFEDIENSCPMVALPSDVARSGKSAQNAFETAFKAMVSILEHGSSDTDHSRRDAAQAIAALCVGGMVIARAIADRALADELRGACMTVALKLGGWKDTSESTPATAKPYRGRASQSVPQARRAARGRGR
jgi:TetR/AcrR family transcriptional regulator, transcriptional repressor for nem operon